MRNHNNFSQTNKVKFLQIFQFILPAAFSSNITFTRRFCDFEGTWKVCSKVGAEGYLDACGMPEPMKSEMLAAAEVVEMKRLGGGKVSSTVC